ncbi:hypothetical protein COOONC_25470 [Cooperia oncophora]
MNDETQRERKPRKSPWSRCGKKRDPSASGVSPAKLGYQSDTNGDPGDVTSAKHPITPKKRGVRITVTADETNIIAYLE